MFVRHPLPTLAALGLILLCGTMPVHSEPALKIIDNPGGGMIVYGQVARQTSEAGAMGAVLRSVHQECGDRPQVGKLFHVRGTNSVAVFFTAVKHTQGDQPVAGMVIASRRGPGDVEAALLTDDASRFGKTINPMLKSLFEVWHPGSAPGSARGGAASPAATLHATVLPDNSASVGLPDGWNVTAQSGGGTIIAEGPNGEAALLGFPLLAMNSSDPRVQRTMAFAQGAGRNTSYANALYYPYGGDPARTFVDLFQLLRQHRGMPQADFQVATAEPMAGGGMSRCSHLTGHVDAQDGKGMKEFNTIFCVGPLSPMGQYMGLAYHIAVPVKFADRERSTVGAILASLRVNEAVVSREANAIAAPAIAQIHEIGRLAAQQAASAHAAEDAQEASVEQRWDSQDKNNQAFSNYLLDQTVIEDTQNNTHGTVWNQTADSLVRNDPDRFAYVDTPNYWKGVDY
ncbi:MAG TPA: hypothetical protein VHY79_00145 [Rhizomicrobium sp.]|jgi:hypothetical protein|nr:hypothetical protein [Rhizomicrobium sp.]